MHANSEELEIRRDLTTDCGVSCPLASEKTHTRIKEKMVSAVFDRILFILAGNNDIHKSLD